MKTVTTVTTVTPWLDRLHHVDRVGWRSLSGKLREDESDAFRDLCAAHGETISERIRRLVLADLAAAAVPYPGPAVTATAAATTGEDA